MALTGEQIQELLDTLKSPVTEFDCGTLCAPDNDGVPLCCHAEAIVPVLYKAEFEMLKRRTDLWRKYMPKTPDQKEMASDMRKCDMLAVCKGAEHCERDNRSITCRTFPFEPYLDHDRQLVGLVWNYDFEGRCPLVNSKHPILKEFIDESLTMWTKMFQMDDVEQDFYFRISQSTRRRFGQWSSKIPVFTRDAVRWFPTRRR